MSEVDDYTEEILERYLTERLLLPDGYLDLIGTAKQQKRDAHGNPVGVSHSNTILDT